MTTTLDRLNAALAGKYDIDREIGSGGMATVYLARDVKHKRNVALKVLKPELGAILGADRFLSEIQVTANLQHPNLLPLFDSGEADGLLYYVMPFIQGESLGTRLDREKQLPIEEAVRISVAIASALAYAHEHGVIHRDLKPENILIQAGQPVIADFGIALAVSNAGGARVTQTGLSLGTPQYMSPEQATGDRDIDARSDIYSLGAVSYEMLTGEPPHSGNSTQAIIAKLMTAEPPPIHVMRPNVPVNVEAAIEKALQKLPADRFSSATEFAHALTNPSFRLNTRSAMAAEIAGESAAATRWKRVSLGLGAALAILLVAALWGWNRQSAPAKTIRYILAFDSAQALNGQVGRIALSPDGNTFAFAGGPESRLYVRPRNELVALPLTGTEGARAPFFSPDGKHLGFSTADFQLKTVPLDGGAPVTVTESIVGQSGGSWGTDGFLYIASRIGESIVRVASASGSVATSVTTLDSATNEVYHKLPDPLPNGKGLIFTVYYGAITQGRTSIAVQNFKTGKHTTLVEGRIGRYSPSGHLIYITSNGTLMAVRFDEDKMQIVGEPTVVAQEVRIGTTGSADLAVSNSGTLMYTVGPSQSNAALVWVSRDGKARQVDSTWQGSFSYPAISPDGKRLAVTYSTVNAFGLRGDIWIKQLDNGPSLKLTVDGVLNSWPSWTPDGRFVTYYSISKPDQNSSDLYTKRADGTAQAKMELPHSYRAAESLWSRDGKWLIYRTVAGSRHIFAIRPGVDSAATQLSPSNADGVSPSLSPDGHFLAYASNLSGVPEIYVVPFPNGDSAKWLVSKGGGAAPRWSHSGSEIFYRNPAGDFISASVTTKPTFSLGPIRVLFSALPYLAQEAHPQFDVAPDDKSFLMIRPISSSVPDKLVIVDNWFGELKSKSNK